MSRMIGTEAIVSLILCGVLTTGIPIAAVIVHKLKHKSASLLSAVIGAATFVVFALILEQILHAVMLPLVMNSTVAYVIYGTLAAGVFEETGRYLACRFLMKNRTDNANAVMLGIGHGGIEAVLIIGVSMFSTLVTAIMVNTMGLDGFIQMTGITDEATLTVLKGQIDTIVAFSMPMALANVVERIIAMTLHICMSVFAMKAASVKGKLWLFPAAIALHALFDVPAALYQRGVISSLWLVELLLGVIVAVFIPITLKVAKIKEQAAEA
ncbi:MAG: YhfC family intramembrane metalloprotease [Oscillospiraceae bacterium]